MIGIIDYRAGNLKSVIKALNHIGADCCVIRANEKHEPIERLILPGVGAFGSAITELRSSGLYQFVDEWLAANKPFLGICLGMQVLCEGSDEADDMSGFARLPVRARRFRSGKIPQIGWNQVRKTGNSRLLKGISDNSFFYFLHGYYVPIVNGFTAGTTDYGTEYASVIEQGSLCAVQFHPEKSGEVGVTLLHNWVAIC
jgi:imidazole glycerol phosphate synthase glutamine amidotransferase subunit